MNLLPYDLALASFARFLAVVSMVGAVIFGGWLVWKMICSRASKEGDAP
jgi:uncharacterized membrane protein (DUF106 family)